MVAYRWSLDAGASRTDPHRLVATSLEKALQTALTEESPLPFQALAKRLVGSKWSFAVSLPLSALFDQTKDVEGKPWHTLAAVEVLTAAGVEGFQSLTALRRLLRATLLERANPQERKAVLEVIRMNAPTARIKANELWDVRSWEELTETDRANIRTAEENHEVAPPLDPREPFLQSEWGGPAWEDNAFAADWPIPVQRPLIELLHSSPAANSGSEAADLESGLAPRLAALSTLLKEPAATETPWKWYLVYWADQALTSLKRLTLIAQGKNPSKDSLPLADYVTVLTERANWWQQLAEWSLKGLADPVPDDHRTQASDSLGWSTTDPIFASLLFLDELLAVESGEPFDSYRERLGEVVSKVWTDWPAYTKTVTLFSLRNYHWSRISQLTGRVGEVLTSETVPRLIMRCLDLVFGRQNKVKRIQEVLTRLPQLSGADELAGFLGRLFGWTTIQSQSGEDPAPELATIATNCDAVLSSPTALGPYTLAFAHGAAWGALGFIRQTDPLTTAHAAAWVPFARKLVELAFVSRPLDAPLEGILQSVLSAMQQRRWPESIRTKLYDEMLPSLEAVIRSGSLGDVSWLHYLLTRELEGEFDDVGEEAGKQGAETVHLAPRDEVLVRLCKASVDRVLGWTRAKQTTNDVGWVFTLRGRDTAELIRKTYQFGRDAVYLQRSLPAVIDVLGEAGLTDVVADLRLLLRRGRNAGA